VLPSLLLLEFESLHPIIIRIKRNEKKIDFIVPP
jgi:hypothetical protein